MKIGTERFHNIPTYSIISVFHFHSLISVTDKVHVSILLPRPNINIGYHRMFEWYWEQR